MAFRSDRTEEPRGRGPAPRIILVLALAALLLRNVPLCWLMPLWSFGDEMGHLDCAMKWGRGHIPQGTDRLEPVLFELYRARTDHRYDSAVPGPPIVSVDQMALGGYTYESKHPPLPYWIMALFLKLFKALGISLFVQVKLFRMLSLAAVAGGIVTLYHGLRRNPRLGTMFYAPLLFIGLLAQDMYFSINTDTFAFLCCSGALVGMMDVLRTPRSRRGWALLTGATVLMMWAKAINAVIFALWGVLAAVLLRKGLDRRVIRLLVASLLIGIALSAPFYIYNQVRFGNPFQYDYSSLFGPNPYPPAGLSPHTAFVFLQAYTRTLFRGEMVWNGSYFDVLPGAKGVYPLTWLPALAFFLGLAQGAVRKSDPEQPFRSFFLVSGILIPAGLAFGYFFIGRVPYYQLRLSLPMIYPVLFVFGLGWTAILRREDLSLAVPSVLLLAYNAAHTFIMLGKVLA
ncbi:MAG TPA: hypothetical protein VHP61_09730 [Acidobacteriota bacterium]|nr:hypothetical protein [Acidobacteriota bacterium]